MMTFSALLRSISNRNTSILDTDIPLTDYTPINLSTSNNDLASYDITDLVECQSYIDTVTRKNNAKVAYGGYLEKRNLYSDKADFSQGVKRNIHLGIDFWTMAGTKVIVPINGTVHSFQNNKTMGDYGPTIILRHDIKGHTFYSLYGHLSMASLEDLTVGKSFKEGDTLATLGTPDINVNYAPHLHFQLIRDMEGKHGDYPGVCSANTLEYFSNNCPDPSLLFQIR